MWFLEEFSNETGYMTREFALADLTGSDVKSILAVDDSDWERPIEAGQNDVPHATVNDFQKFSTKRIDARPECEYEIALRAADSSKPEKQWRKENEHQVGWRIPQTSGCVRPGRTGTRPLDQQFRRKAREMWYLDEFDKKSESLIRSYLLHGVTSSVIKALIHYDESEVPLEAAVHQIEPTELPRFAQYVHGELEINSHCDYFIGLYAE